MTWIQIDPWSSENTRPKHSPWLPEILVNVEMFWVIQQCVNAKAVIWTSSSQVYCLQENHFICSSLLHALVIQSLFVNNFLYRRCWFKSRPTYDPIRNKYPNVKIQDLRPYSVNAGETVVIATDEGSCCQSVSENIF